MFEEEIKIPKERVGVLIGIDGKVKKEIEKEGKVKLNIDSKEGVVTISGEESINIFEIRIMVKAIGRGFSPEIAMKLFDEDYAFELLDIQDYAGKLPKNIKRLKGRVIGQEGKSRKMIEEITETNISVYGKTIGIIGEAEGTDMARRAVEMLLQGSPHGNVYKWLENKRREVNKRKFEEGL